MKSHRIPAFQSGVKKSNYKGKPLIAFIGISEHGKKTKEVFGKMGWTAILGADREIQTKQQGKSKIVMSRLAKRIKEHP